MKPKEKLKSAATAMGSATKKETSGGGGEHPTQTVVGLEVVQNIKDKDALPKKSADVDEVKIGGAMLDQMREKVKDSFKEMIVCMMILLKYKVMKQACPSAILLALILSTAFVACSPSKRLSSVSANETRSLISVWPNMPKEVAQKMISKYGAPNEVTNTMLVWHNNGPWKRTIVYKEEILHDFPKPHTDLLEQFIDYKVPPEKFDDLAQYDGSVIAERTKGEISARCDMEEMNFLALNLAHDIATGKKTVEQGRDYYTRAVKEFMQGKVDPYVQKLQFDIPKGNTGDPDIPRI